MFTIIEEKIKEQSLCSSLIALSFSFQPPMSPYMFCWCQANYEFKIRGGIRIPGIKAKLVRRCGRQQEGQKERKLPAIPSLSELAGLYFRNLIQRGDHIIQATDTEQ